MGQRARGYIQYITVLYKKLFVLPRTEIGEVVAEFRRPDAGTWKWEVRVALLTTVDTTADFKRAHVKMNSPTDTMEDQTETTCPLFMEGLPSDFATNPSLAALASLLEEDDDTTKPVSSSKVAMIQQPSAGGGKVRARKSRMGRKSDPYPKSVQQKKTSMGEAELFLKMWKI
jgi:hypothetical protein